MRGFPVPPVKPVERRPIQRVTQIAVMTPPRPAPRGATRAIPSVTAPTVRLAPTPLAADPKPRRRFIARSR